MTTNASTVLNDATLDVRIKQPTVSGLAPVRAV
jgi:hypothetical protein